MADISKIIPVAGGTEYNIKDSYARSTIQTIMIQGGGDIIQDPDGNGGMVSTGFNFGGAVNAHIDNKKLVIISGSLVSNGKLIL